MAFSPWLKNGKKICSADGDPMLCEKCPCECEICDRLALNPPDGFTRGWFFEVTGIPCGHSCADQPQTFTLDYSAYHEADPYWQTCAWRERAGTCIVWYAVTPGCEMIEWARLEDCESSSSGSSSSASSSSILDYDCICQAYREDPAGSIYYATTSCDVEDPPPLPEMTVGEAYEMYVAQGGLVPPLFYDKICGAAKYTRWTNDKPFTAGMVEAYYYEDTWDEQTQQCVRTWEARFAPWHLEAEKGMAYDEPCDETQFPQENAEDDLI